VVGAARRDAHRQYRSLTGSPCLRDGLQTIHHQSSVGHAGETGDGQGVTPTAAEIKVNPRERIYEVFHNGIDGDDDRKENIKMAPPAGTAEPTMENDGKQNHVLRQRKILIGRTIGLELGGEVLPWDDEEQVQVQAHNKSKSRSRVPRR